MRSAIALRAFAAAALIATVASPVSAKDPIAVMIDHAKVMRISSPAATVVIGNPAIADASVQDRQTLVITGKIIGVTNLVILDGKGELIADETIRVEKSEAGKVTVQRGASRYTYACTPNCGMTMEPGDTPDYFGAASSQLSGRNGFVAGAAGPTQ